MPARLPPLDLHGSEREVQPKDFIKTLEDALLELLVAYPDPDDLAGLVLNRIDCQPVADRYHNLTSASDLPDSSQNLSETTRDSEGDADSIPEVIDELEEDETGVYLCRWPNGDCSVVTADTRKAAILALDEWGSARSSFLHPIPSLMADFSVTSTGQLKLRELSEVSSETIWRTAYPHLHAQLTDDGLYDSEGCLTSEGRAQIHKAVLLERSRLRGQPKHKPETELGKALAEQMDASAVVADEYVRRYAIDLLKRLPKSKKPN